MKIQKILGVGLSLMLMASLFVFAVPASATGPGEQQWDYMSEPGYLGYKIYNSYYANDLAINGQYMYIAPHSPASSSYPVSNQRLVRSSNSGWTWSSKYAWRDAGYQEPMLIAVAPDDKLSIAVVDNLSNIYISSDEGDTLSQLPALPAASAGGVITDIAVGPARTGLLLSREYFVTVADPTPSATATATMVGDVYMLGASATWVSAGSTTGIAGTLDYMRVELSPNFSGDRVVVAIGADNTSATGIVAQVINTSTKAVLSTTTLIAAALDYQASATGIYAADIAFPSDYDPTSTTNDMFFVSTASSSSDDDVFKVTPLDGTTMADLGANADLKSVAYSGTADSGTLFVGYYSAGTVKRCYDPFASSPTWKTNTKAPTGNSAIVRIDSSYAFNKTVYALTISG
ncbi:MAG: hypothetical protein WC369_06165, partial [Dehalococcoidales bacterium]